MKHPGFAAVSNSIAQRQGIPIDSARAILAAKTRSASPRAKKKNPKLKKVRG